MIAFTGLDEKQLGQNFAIAKFFSILMVVTGHYFEGTILWVPVSIGLFIFAFSSGYFLAVKYQGKFSVKLFWLNKFRRLFPALIVIDFFLFVLFVIEGRTIPLNIHTLLALSGMSGVLDWLGIHNQSPFGNGLWFFTVLLIFYVAYPFINILCSRRIGVYLFILFSVILCGFGHFYASPPYALWLTVFGFCFGVFACRVEWKPRRLYSWIAVAVAGVLFVLFNVFGVKWLNIIFLVFISISVMATLLTTSFGDVSPRWVSLFTPCILEIYFIHTYLFYKGDDFNVVLGFILSLFIILVSSLILYKFRLKLAASAF